MGIKSKLIQAGIKVTANNKILKKDLEKAIRVIADKSSHDGTFLFTWDEGKAHLDGFDDNIDFTKELTDLGINKGEDGTYLELDFDLKFDYTAGCDQHFNRREECWEPPEPQVIDIIGLSIWSNGKYVDAKKILNIIGDEYFLDLLEGYEPEIYEPEYERE